MSRPKLDVADIFRRHGEAWRRDSVGDVSCALLRVMSAIEACRTAALGGHVERCEDCAHTREEDDMTAEERANALVKRLDRSNLSEWPDIVASAIREAENNILAQASERLEGEDAQLSPAGGSGPCARTYAQITIVRTALHQGRRR